MTYIRLPFDGVVVDEAPARREIYPDTPGWKAQETSQAAAAAMESTAATIRARVLVELARSAATADETARRLALSILSVRPRFSELHARGLIVDTGERRPNQSGHKAIVWERAAG